MTSKHIGIMTFSDDLPRDTFELLLSSWLRAQAIK